MDRTSEFVEIVRSAPSSENNLSALSRSRCASPFVLKASAILEKLSSFEGVLLQVYVDYVHDHRSRPSSSISASSSRSGGQLKGAAPSSSIRMSESERNELNQEITLFIAAIASELNELKYMLGQSSSEVTIDLTWLQSLCPSSRSHYQEIVAFVSTKLSAFTKQVQILHRERKRLSLDPLRIYSTDYDVYDDADGNLLANTKAPQSRFSSLFDRSEGSTAATARGSRAKKSYHSGAGKGSTDRHISTSFVAKYEKEAGPASKLKLYDSLAAKHKAALVKEASSMQVKFSEDLQNATQMERTVNQIGDLLTEFASILQSQSGQVEEVNDDAKQTEEHVKSSKSQLQLTIERSEKNQKSIVFLSVGLALLLLLLDWIER